jgi:hypothetical protein
MKELSAVEIHHQLKDVYGKYDMSQQCAVKWYSEFRGRSVRSDDRERNGRSTIAEAADKCAHGKCDLQQQKDFSE